MALENTIVANIAKCSEGLHRLRQYLHEVGLYDAAEDAYNAQVNLHLVRRQHNESTEQSIHAIEALRRDVANEQTVVQKAKRLAQILQDKLEKQEAMIAEHNRTIQNLKRDLNSASSDAQNETTRKYREGYTAGVAACQEKIEHQEVTIRTHASTIQHLRRDLDTSRLNGQAESDRRRQEGYAAGFAAGREAARPPPPPPQPIVDQETRMFWMTSILLSSPSQIQLSSHLKQAIISGNKDIIASILRTQNVDLAPPALHLAALFGDVDVARLLLAHGMEVNSQCIARSDKAGSHVYGVTPMHLAIGAQHENMIRLLHHHGGSFEARLAEAGTRTPAPPLWLISDRWLKLTRKDRPESVVRILRILKGLGWDVESRLNREGKTMEDLVRDGYLKERVDVKRAVLAVLQE